MKACIRQQDARVLGVRTDRRIRGRVERRCVGGSESVVRGRVASFRRVDRARRVDDIGRIARRASGIAKARGPRFGAGGQREEAESETSRATHRRIFRQTRRSENGAQQQPGPHAAGPSVACEPTGPQSNKPRCVISALTRKWAE